ncbi:unnamed protein product [Sphagnum jensenii]
MYFPRSKTTHKTTIDRTGRNSDPQSQNETKIRTPKSQQNATRNFERGTRLAARVRDEQNRERRLRTSQRREGREREGGKLANATRDGNVRTQTVKNYNIDTLLRSHCSHVSDL